MTSVVEQRSIWSGPIRRALEGLQRDLNELKGVVAQTAVEVEQLRADVSTFREQQQPPSGDPSWP